METEPMAAKHSYPHDEPLLTTKEAARFLRLSHRTLEGFRTILHQGRTGSPFARSLSPCRHSHMDGASVLVDVGVWDVSFKSSSSTLQDLTLLRTGGSRYGGRVSPHHLCWPSTWPLGRESGSRCRPADRRKSSAYRGCHSLLSHWMASSAMTRNWDHVMQ